MKRYLTSTSSSDSNPSFVSFFIVLLLYHHNPLLANERNRKEVGFSRYNLSIRAFYCFYFNCYVMDRISRFHMQKYTLYNMFCHGIFSKNQNFCFFISILRVERPYYILIMKGCYDYLDVYIVHHP